MTLEILEKRSEGDRRVTSESGLVGFVLKRKHLADPPRDYVRRKNGAPLAAGFVDHGDTFHEVLCDAFLGRAQEELSRVTVSYPPGHAALTDSRPMLVVAGMWGVHLPPLTPAEIQPMLQQADARDQLWLERTFRAWSAADERWFRLRCPPRLVLEGVYATARGDWEEVPVAEVVARLDPRGDGNRMASARTEAPRAIPGDAIEAARRRRALAAVKGQSLAEHERAERLHLIDAELARYTADCENEAAYYRARATEDMKQRRMIESVAERVEARLGAVNTFTAWRRAKFAGGGMPKHRSDDHFRALLIYAAERS